MTVAGDFEAPRVPERTPPMYANGHEPRIGDLVSLRRNDGQYLVGKLVEVDRDIGKVAHLDMQPISDDLIPHVANPVVTSAGTMSLRILYCTEELRGITKLDPYWVSRQ